MPTKKLFYQSAYLTECTSQMIKTIKKEDGNYIVLEETVFYPTGGGQPHDEGLINGITVLDVVLEDDEVLHKVERLPETTEVQCQIDWKRRFDHMQQHSGQHMLSAVCRDLYQAMTVSFHLGIDSCSIDIELPEVKAEQLTAIELEVNRRIYQNLKIESYFVTPEQMSQLDLVKPPKVTENIRIVEIQGVEHNACGGTHVSSTGELGMIKLLKAEKQKGNTRIYFKCGFRALEEYNDQLRVLGSICLKFNTNKDDVMDRIEKWESEQKQLQSELNNVKEKYDIYIAKELLSNMEGNMVSQIFEDKNLKELQSLAAKLTAMTDLPVLLASSPEMKVVLANSGNSGFSSGAFYKEHLGAFGGKGGGSDKIAQAGFSTWEDAKQFYEFSKGEILNES